MLYISFLLQYIQLKCHPVKYYEWHVYILNAYKRNPLNLKYTGYYQDIGTWVQFHNQEFTLSVNPNNC